MTEHGRVPADFLAFVLSVLAWRESDKGVKIDFRPVHMNTLDTDVDVIPPKKRVY